MRLSIKKGLRLFKNDQVWTIERRTMDGLLLLLTEEGDVIKASESEILAGCAKREWALDPSQANEVVPVMALPNRDLSTFSVAAQREARRRQNYLNWLTKGGKLISSPDKLEKKILEAAKEMGDSNPPSPISVYRWHRRYKSASIVELVDRREGRGRHLPWSKEVKGVVQDIIDQIYLNTQKFPIKAVYEELQRRLMALQKLNPEQIHNLAIPSRSSIYRYVQNLKKYDIDAARMGKSAADRKYRGVFGKQMAERILERWEIDHTPLDLIVYDEETRMPHGRPWLTAAIDKHSRIIVGIYIGFGNPSAYAVLQCLRQAILPKDELLRQYSDITLPWPARGIPEAIVCDNGMELHSISMIKACQELNIQIQFCPAKLPEYKGSIERFFRTIAKDLIHRLPGTTFSNIWERGDYESENLACIGFKTLNALLYKWIVEIYHQEIHRGTGLPPALMWEKGERERLIEYPANPEQLWIITAHVAERTLFRYGIEINGLKYNCPELQSLYRRHGSNLKLTLKYQEDDISLIHAYDPDEKVYLKVPAIDQEYALGLTLDQHELIRQALRNEAKDYMDRTLILEKKRELQALIDAAVVHKKMGVRKKVAKIRKVDSVTPGGIAIQPSTPSKPSDLLPVFHVADGDLPTFTVSRNNLYRDHSGNND